MLKNNKNPIMLGVDPGLAHFGWALVELVPGRVSEPPRDRVLSFGCFTTEKSDKKRRVLVADDNVRRGRELSLYLHQEVVALRAGGRIAVVAAESMSHPRAAQNAAKLALSWGVVITLAERCQLPIVQASPQEIKKELCGRRDASKEDIEDALLRRRDLEWSEEAAQQEHDFNKTEREHPFDALAACVTARHSDVVRALRARDGGAR